MARGRKGFPKEIRLRRRREFVRVQEQGTKFTQDCLLALAIENAGGHRVTRLGLTVSAKVGNAVVRNRVRRRLREVFRERKGLLPQGLDVVLIARASAAQADLPRLARAFTRLSEDIRRSF